MKLAVADVSFMIFLHSGPVYKAIAWVERREAGREKDSMELVAPVYTLHDKGLAIVLWFVCHSAQPSKYMLYFFHCSTRMMSMGAKAIKLYCYQLAPSWMIPLIGWKLTGCRLPESFSEWAWKLCSTGCQCWELQLCWNLWGVLSWNLWNECDMKAIRKSGVHFQLSESLWWPKQLCTLYAVPLEFDIFVYATHNSIKEPEEVEQEPATHNEDFFVTKWEESLAFQKQSVYVA